MAENNNGRLTECFRRDADEVLRADKRKRNEDRDPESPPNKKQEVDCPGSVESKNSSMLSMVTQELGNLSRQGTNIHENKAKPKSLFRWPTTKRIRRVFKKEIEQSLWDRLTVLTKNDFNIKHGSEIVDSVHLLNLFNVSNSEYESFIQSAGAGENRLREGLKLVEEGYDMIKSAVSLKATTG